MTDKSFVFDRTDAKHVYNLNSEIWNSKVSLNL